MTTREEILTTAKELFIRYGYHHVSMRTISSAMGISVGNLTYYFPRKANLADALLEEEMAQILVPVRPGLDALDNYMRRTLLSLLKNARLFSDLMMFLPVRELAEGHRERTKRLQDNMLALLNAQIDAGLLCLPEPEASVEKLSDLLLFSRLGWQQRLMLFPQPSEQAVEYAMDLQWAVLHPWLTAAGLCQLEQLRRS